MPTNYSPSRTIEVSTSNPHPSSFEPIAFIDPSDKVSRVNKKYMAFFIVGGGIVGAMILGIVALWCISFISTIVMFATDWDGSSGWVGIQEHCSTDLRSVMLATIVLQFVVGNIVARMNSKGVDWHLYSGSLMFLTFIILGSFLAGLYSNTVNGNSNCSAYMNTTYGSFDSPLNVVLYQLINSWFAVLVGLGYMISGFCFSS